MSHPARIVLPFVLLALLGLAFTGSGAVDDQGVVVEAPQYELLIGDNLIGSGFHFESRGERYIGCSLHQSDGEIPESMISLDADGGITVTGRVSAGHDIQILRYNCPQLDEIPALVYSPNAEVLIGDPVYLYGAQGVSVGRIDRKGQKRRRLVRMEQPFRAAGMSGSPVVSAVTGTVIGVLLDANDPEAATVVGFELLKME